MSKHTVNRFGWTKGNHGAYLYSAKVATEPSPWGVIGSKVIKLIITDDKDTEIFHFQRGWVTPPQTVQDRKVAREIIRKLSAMVITLDDVCRRDCGCLPDE